MIGSGTYVDEDIDAAKPGARGLGDLIDRGVAGQIRLDGEEIVPLSLLTCAGGECLQRLTVAVDAGDPDTCCEQAVRHGPAEPPAAPVTIATLWVSLMTWFLLLNCRPT